MTRDAVFLTDMDNLSDAIARRETGSSPPSRRRPRPR